MYVSEDQFVTSPKFEAPSYSIPVDSEGVVDSNQHNGSASDQTEPSPLSFSGHPMLAVRSHL